MKGTLASLTSRRTALPVLLLTNRIDTPFEVMVARRGLRLSNRNGIAARLYEATQLALRAAVKGRG